MTEITFIVNRNDVEYELNVCGYVDPYIPANFDGHPDDWTPEEGGTVDIDQITIDLNGQEESWKGQLTKQETNEVESCLIETTVLLSQDQDCNDYCEDIIEDDVYVDYLNF